MFVRFAGDRHAVSLQPERLTDLRRRRNSEAKRLASKRRYFGLAAEHCRRQRNLDFGVEIAALPLESRMRRLPDPQIQVAALAAVRALLALARHADARSFADARGDPDVDRARVAVVFDRKAQHLAVVGVLERQLDFLLEIAALARPARGARARPAAPGVVLAAHRSAEEGLEEIGEGVRVAEHLPHF